MTKRQTKRQTKRIMTKSEVNRLLLKATKEIIDDFSHDDIDLIAMQEIFSRLNQNITKEMCVNIINALNSQIFPSPEITFID